MLSLITKGMIFRKYVTVNRYVLPYTIIVKRQDKIDLQIKAINNLNLNVENVVDKQINFKLNENQINIKKHIS
jgi:hypothetical protein